MAGSRLAGRLHAVDRTTLAAALTGIAAAAVIRTTMLPTIGAWDTGEAQVVLPTLGTMHPTGFPAFVVLGWLFSIVFQPLGSPAFLMNLMAVVLVGAATGGAVLVVRRLGSPLPVAVAIAAGFAVTPLVWGIGTAVDVHALHLALVVAVVLGLIRWATLVDRWRASPGDDSLRRRADRGIVVTAAVFGLALANHGLAVLLIPPIGLYVLVVDPQVLRRPRLIVAALGACLGVAALFYLELPLRAGILRAPLVYGHPETWNGFWEIVLARQFQADVVGPLGDPLGKGRALLDIASAQLGPLVALLPFGILATAIRRPRYALLSITATAITCFFAASYVNARIDRYYLVPVFFAWTWIGVLADTVVRRLLGSPGGASGVTGEEPGGDAPAPLTIPGRPGPETILAIAVSVTLLVPTMADLSTRWHTLDRSRETWVESWLDQAFTALEPDAVVVSWWSYSTPLWYGQLVEGRRPDVWVVDDRTRLDLNLGEIDDVIDANLGRRPVYVMRVTESDVQDLARRYAIEPVGRPGNLYRVTGRLETSP